MSSRDMESVNSKGRTFLVEKFDTELNKNAKTVWTLMNISKKNIENGCSMKWIGKLEK